MNVIQLWMRRETLMEMGRPMETYILLTHVNGALGGHQNPRDSLEGPRHVDTFLQCNPPTYDGSPLNTNAENWIHKMRAILQASEFRPSTWVSLTVMQLRGKFATLWEATGHVPW